MELQIKEYNLPETIGFNYDELKKEIVESLEKYQNLVVTPENLDESTKTRQQLNKFKESIEAKRKEIKNKWLAPYNDFEANIKKLVALVDEPIACLDTQLKAFEDKRKEEKLAEINQLILKHQLSYSEANPECPFDASKIIIDARWLNKTAKQKDIDNAIVDQFEQQLDEYEATKRETELIKTVFDTLPDDSYRASMSLDKYLERYKYTKDVNGIVKDMKAEYAQNKKTANDNNTTVVGDINVFTEAVDKETLSQAMVADPFEGLSVNTLTRAQCKELINGLITTSDYDDNTKEQLLKFMEEI